MATIDFKTKLAVEPEAEAVGAPAEPMNPQALAMLDVLVTAEMLYTYALQYLEQEFGTDQLDSIQASAKAEQARIKQFSLSDIRNRLVDAQQVVMIDIAEIVLKAKAQAEAETAAPEIIV